MFGMFSAEFVAPPSGMPLKRHWYLSAAPLAPTTVISGNTYVGGADAAGTVFTAVLYDAAVLGSSARVNAGTGVNTTPKVVYWIDKGPPGIAP